MASITDMPSETQPNTAYPAPPRPGSRLELSTRLMKNCEVAELGLGVRAIATPLAWWLARSRGFAGELVGAVVALPIVLFSLFAGAMADNMDRRKVMLGAQMFMLCVSIALTVCAWLGMNTPWLLLMFTRFALRHLFSFASGSQ